MIKFLLSVTMIHSLDPQLFNCRRPESIDNDKGYREWQTRKERKQSGKRITHRHHPSGHMHIFLSYF